MANLIFILAGLVTICLFFYTVGKDLWIYISHKSDNPNIQKNEDMIQYNEVPKNVNFNYPDAAGLKTQWENEGYAISWVSPKNVESNKIKGFEIMYLTDDAKHEKYYLQILDSRGIPELILMGLKKHD